MKIGSGESTRQAPFHFSSLFRAQSVHTPYTRSFPVPSVLPSVSTQSPESRSSTFPSSSLQFFNG